MAYFLFKQFNSKQFLITLTAHAFFCFCSTQSKKKNNILLFNGILFYNLA